MIIMQTTGNSVRFFSMSTLIIGYWLSPIEFSFFALQGPAIILDFNFYSHVNHDVMT